VGLEVVLGSGSGSDGVVVGAGGAVVEEVGSGDWLEDGVEDGSGTSGGEAVPQPNVTSSVQVSPPPTVTVVRFPLAPIVCCPGGRPPTE